MSPTDPTAGPRPEICGAPVLVLGRHRSGTSCLAASRKEAGLCPGAVNREPPHDRKGNHETRAITDLNDRVFANLDATRDKPPRGPVPWTPEQEAGRNALLATYPKGRVWGFNEPRTVLTLERCRAALPVGPLAGSLRTPLAAVAASLAGRNKFPQARAVALAGLQGPPAGRHVRDRVSPRRYRRTARRLRHGTGPSPDAAGPYGAAGGVRLFRQLAQGQRRPGRHRYLTRSGPSRRRAERAPDSSAPFLSILIVAYDIRREILRTLASAPPPLQRQVDPSECEIVALANGSPEPLARPDAPETVRLVRTAPEDAAPSPVFAINSTVRGICRGETLLICIDGARMFSALLVRRTIDMLARWPEATSYVQSRHTGSEPNGKAVTTGYAQAAEDALMATVTRQEDLDALWEISVLAGCHRPNRPILQNESNALGMSRATWTALGDYNEGFTRPGGGLCNLELFSRMLSRTDGPAILLDGEATFHQFHGGAATAHPVYFAASKAEFAAATGSDYAWPPRSFLIAPAIAYDRPSSAERGG
ncbi:hypothetical protein [Jannaschia seohaensis]|uniref:Uncharacterized protein n=1 Tax=Jannaschia seohaensis TaxID=475081 RepID=A0A2Y9A3C8_9RHOB|nr:hypothetical protein [Jannaschia seohaensis]PWJ22068.1 hypothetical protein BCF38_101477 [Jannaschia seohaensis]SSA38346.1 hypothetical protein SAMN05421539_101477 [Jannaschia seohaensis]